jgi:hypothetical protein
MHLSKAEMEDIWYNKPVGHLKMLKAKLKNQKKYEVVLQPYNYVYHDKQTFEVIAKSSVYASADAKYLANQQNKGARYEGFVIYSVVEKR